MQCVRHASQQCFLANWNNGFAKHSTFFGFWVPVWSFKANVTDAHECAECAHSDVFCTLRYPLGWLRRCYAKGNGAAPTTCVTLYVALFPAECGHKFPSARSRSAFEFAALFDAAGPYRVNSAFSNDVYAPRGTSMKWNARSGGQWVRYPGYMATGLECALVMNYPWLLM
jgi:hypothetical protein